MKITDLDGRVIGITDLQLALLQTGGCHHYQLSAPEAEEFNKKHQAYWDGFYRRLLLLQAGGAT